MLSLSLAFSTDKLLTINHKKDKKRWTEKNCPSFYYGKKTITYVSTKANNTIIGIKIVNKAFPIENRFASEIAITIFTKDQKVETNSTIFPIISIGASVNSFSFKKDTGSNIAQANINGNASNNGIFA